MKQLISLISFGCILGLLSRELGDGFKHERLREEFKIVVLSFQSGAIGFSSCE